MYKEGYFGCTRRVIDGCTKRVIDGCAKRVIDACTKRVINGCTNRDLLYIQLYVFLVGGHFRNEPCRPPEAVEGGVQR